MTPAVYSEAMTTYGQVVGRYYTATGKNAHSTNSECYVTTQATKYIIQYIIDNVAATLQKLVLNGKAGARTRIVRSLWVYAVLARRAGSRWMGETISFNAGGGKSGGSS